MSKNTYHILNGDSLLFQFPPEIEGNRIVMREALMDGPINANSFDQFVEDRSRYLCEDDPNEYIEIMPPKMVSLHLY